MKTYAVIGCGRFGSSVAKTLFELGNEVLVIDNNPEILKEISQYATYSVEADAMDESALEELGLSNFDVAIIGIGSNLEASIMATLLVKKLGVENVVAKAQSDLHGMILNKIGADKVVYPERDMGSRVAHNLISNSVLDYIELSSDVSILEIETLDIWNDKTLGELRIRNKYGANVIAVRQGKNINFSIGADYLIKSDDVLILIGDSKNILNIEKKSKK